MRVMATRYHDFSAGHRVVGHEGKCCHLHGHNYRVEFYCEAQQLDALGRVIDFGVIKSTLCQWLEDNWDHKMLLWSRDPMLPQVLELDPHGVHPVPVNPTAENLATYLIDVVGPKVLAGTGVRLAAVRMSETRKCGVTARRSDD